MELTVLTVPDCPHGPVLEERLAQVLDEVGRAGVPVVRRVIADQQEAARWGMRGSPTLLIDGVDPFAEPATAASVSCRMYRGPDGRLQGAPSVAALHQALAADQPAPAAEPGPDPLDRGGTGRLAPVERGLRAVQQRVLRAFAATGLAPGPDELAAAAAPYQAAAVLAELHAADFLRLDQSGRIRAAYPFSAVPTAHLVEIEDGPQVYAMCAIDALGMAAMLKTSVRITSFDPRSDEAVTVTVPASGSGAVWDPATGVAFAGRRAKSRVDSRVDSGVDSRVGQQAECASCEEPTMATRAAAIDLCCGYVNFFTTPAGAAAWERAHPQVVGQVLGQADAERLGAAIFGPLLTDPPNTR